MKQNSAFMAMSLVFILSFACCCCGGLGGDQLQELLGGNLDAFVEEAVEVQMDLAELEEMVGTPTPEAEPGEVQEEAAEAAPAEDTADMPADESGQEESTDLIPDLPDIEIPDIEGNEEQAAQEILEAIEEQLAQDGEEPFSFGCDDPSIPMPADVEGCVSVAGFTTYSTAMSDTEINQLYDDYFLGQGWEHFPDVIQEEVLNAWTNEATQGVALLSFTAGGGENGKNMVNLAVITE
jgi:hypothetical protein